MADPTAIRGTLAIVGTSTIWGLSALFFKALADVPPVEVLAHRVVWSGLFLAAILAAQRRLPEIRALLRDRRSLGVLALAAAMVALNWFTYIFAIGAGHALEASLGYYIFPLLAVLLGFALLGERFSAGQAAAIALAASGVAVLTWGLGTAPFIALILAGSFALYGLLKNRLALGPVISVFAETALLAPLAVAWLLLAPASPGGFGDDPATTALLLAAGPLTGVPLILFSYAARRLPYATLGLIQYLNPTLQFAIAVAVFGEPFTPWHGLAFPLIWTALALYSFEAWRKERRARRSGISPATVA